MKSMKGLHQSSSFSDINTSRGGAEVWFVDVVVDRLGPEV
jgi:hypothetical protein